MYLSTASTVLGLVLALYVKVLGLGKYFLMFSLNISLYLKNLEKLPCVYCCFSFSQSVMTWNINGAKNNCNENDRMFIVILYRAS